METKKRKIIILIISLMVIGYTFLKIISFEKKEIIKSVDLILSYETELAKFPPDYQAKIIALHDVYPNAIFTYMKADINFSDFISLEYDLHYKGWSLLWDSNASYDGLKSTDSWAYSFYTNIFNRDFVGGGTNWYAASKQTIGYFVDPRNFLNKENIFMFEKLSYYPGYHNKAGVERILQGSFMHNTNINGVTNKTFADAFIEAAINTNVNPYFLASRVIQEIGYTRSEMVSGNYSEYMGYYNFYNIQAFGSTVEETIKSGLSYAKSKEWNTEYKAIVEGASFVGNNYISQGQDTLYFQKWDVFPPVYATHQYMQNIQSPYSESIKVYNAYDSINILDGYYIFDIPVFDSMPALTSLANSGNPNNYLKSLTVNGSTVSDFDGKKTDYAINVSPLLNSVEIADTKVFSGTTVSGTGTIKLTELSQDIPVIVTAKNGDVRKYKITVTRNIDVPLAISEILNTMRLNSDGIHISNVSLNTTVEQFAEDIKAISPQSLANFTSNSSVKTTGIIATGDSITITSDNDTKTYTFVIYGDINGDGLINSADLLAIRQHLVGVKELRNAYFEAANVTKSGKELNSADLLRLRQHLVGANLIIQ